MKKSLFLIVIVLNLGISTMSLSAFNGSGNGDAGSPYLITTASELNEVRDNLSAHYKLMNSIDLTDWLAENSATEGWNPISVFKGTFDGNGFVISGLWIERPTTENVGFFGSVAGAVIKRLGLIIPEGGGIVGYKYVGGLVGHTPYTTSAISIDECFVVGGTIESKDQACGGIMGYTSTNSVTVNIRNSYTANSIIISKDGAGGIIGTAYRNVNIENCYSTNKVVSTNNDKASGGIAGSFNDAKDSYTIKHSLALNPQIVSTKSSSRIIGWVKSLAKSTLLKNLAFEGMLVNNLLVSGSENDLNGLGIKKSELVQQETYSGLGWNFDESNGVWCFGNENYALPILKNIVCEKQPLIMPAHLLDSSLPSDLDGEKESYLSIYPSITKGDVFISNKEATSIVQVYDLMGKIVLRSSSSQINISSCANGIYLFQVEDNIVKIVKE